MRLPSRFGAACCKSDRAATTCRKPQDGNYRFSCSVTARNTVTFMVRNALRIGREPPRRSACEFRDRDEDEDFRVLSDLVFIVLLRCELCLRSRSDPPHLPIRTHRLEASGRSL